jgi:myosin heavy subunit
LANLEARIGEVDPLAYTYLNTVLVAVNPLKQLKHQPSFEDYVDKSFDPDTPHPYAIAELSYQNLRTPRSSEPGSQSIVISGESGAGKTETAKIVLAYLSNRSSGDGIVDVGNARVSECILDSTPIFEEFGNAKTTRNSNSSRFGKFISLQFSPGLSYTLIGAFVTTYLLEKTRVCYQMLGERNYHIFYDLLSGAARAIPELCLDPSPDVYYYLSSSAAAAASSSSSSSSCQQQQIQEAGGNGEPGMFEHVCSAFNVVGIGESELLEIWKLLAGILHLGNTGIEEADTVEGLKAAIRDDGSKRNAALAANMFGVGVEQLVSLLTVKITIVRSQEIVIKLQQDEAIFRRDAVSKALYNGLFEHLVKAANGHLGYKRGEPLPFIGVLDIFGFESFKVNGLEQILINFANEYLQNVFNKQVFEAELKLFKEENITCSLDEYPDNSPCVDMLSAKRGVLGILNEQCAQVKPSEDKFVRDLVKEHKASPWFPTVHRKDARDSFRVRHFAGPVQYTVNGWLLKNTDPLPENLPAIFGAGNLPLVRKIFDKDSATNPGAAASAAGDSKCNSTVDAGVALSGRGARARKNAATTVSKAFVASMNMLTANLAKTKCNFIRCIKPNSFMRPGVYNRSYVVEQLRCLGILATCEVLKAGMPTRVTYQELKTALTDLPRSTLDLFLAQPDEVMIAASMWAFEVPADAYQLGRTRVFFKAGEISRVERMLKVDLSGETGELINDRMRLALERRRQALQAVQCLEATVARTRSDVEGVSQVHEDIEDCARQVDHDCVLALDTLQSVAKKIEAEDRRVSDARERLAQLKGHPIFTLGLESGDEESGAVSRAIEAANAALRTAESAIAAITHDHDVAGTKKRYAALNGEAHGLLADTRHVVSDILRGFARVEKLHAEAEDGAKRCLLDYTLERAQQAEAELDSVVSLTSEIRDSGDLQAKVHDFGLRNGLLHDGIAVMIPVIDELLSTAAGGINMVRFGAPSCSYTPLPPFSPSTRNTWPSTDFYLFARPHFRFRRK